MLRIRPSVKSSGAQCLCDEVRSNQRATSINDPGCIVPSSDRDCFTESPMQIIRVRETKRLSAVDDNGVLDTGIEFTVGRTAG
jgi:hypothetical protein